MNISQFQSNDSVFILAAVPSMSVFLPKVCLYQNFVWFYEIGSLKYNRRKKAKKGDFQVIGSLLYEHYTLYFNLLFEQYEHILCSVKIQEQF